MVAVSCHNASRNAPTQTPDAVTSIPNPAPTTVYVARDYGEPGQPDLRAADIAQLRKVLREVKPCQRKLLRYIVDRAERPSVEIFFAVKTIGNSTTAPHVFGTRNLYYFDVDGTVKPAMSVESDQHAIADQACGD